MCAQGVRNDPRCPTAARRARRAVESLALGSARARAGGHPRGGDLLLCSTAQHHHQHRRHADGQPCRSNGLTFGCTADPGAAYAADLGATSRIGNACSSPDQASRAHASAAQCDARSDRGHGHASASRGRASASVDANGVVRYAGDGCARGHATGVAHARVSAQPDRLHRSGFQSRWSWQSALRSGREPRGACG